MVRFGCTDNRRGEGRLTQHPCESKLGSGNAALFCDFTEAVYNLLVGFLCVRVQALSELICFVSFRGFALPGTSQAATQ